MKLIINKGDKFSYLTIIKEVSPRVQPSGQKPRTFLCRCICGSTKEIRLSHLTRGRVKSCGCNNGKRSIHGEVNTHLYNVWRGIKLRVTKKHYERHLYYDRGIALCQEWELYSNFRDWALKNGYSKELQIDRIDNNEGYFPENCRFVEPYVNVNNRRNTVFVEYNSKRKPLMILLRELNKYDIRETIYSRINRGWSAQKAIDTPIRKGNYKKKWVLNIGRK
jgi:hypothetical protein